MVLALIANFNVNAGMITIDTSDTAVEAGDAITVNLLATDFAPIDTFGFRLNLDTSVFSFNPTSLMSGLSLSNPFGFLEVNAFDGYIAFSFLDFDPIISPDFTLASFTLTAQSIGASDISFSQVEFFQGGFLPVVIDSTSTVSVSVTEVPEPATWMLLPLMLAFLTARQVKLNH